MSKPGKVLKGLCKKLGVRLTVKRNGKRMYKSITVLKRQCANKKKKKKVKKKVVKRRAKFGKLFVPEGFFVTPNKPLHTGGFFVTRPPNKPLHIGGLFGGGPHHEYGKYGKYGPVPKGLKGGPHHEYGKYGKYGPVPKGLKGGHLELVGGKYGPVPKGPYNFGKLTKRKKKKKKKKKRKFKKKKVVRRRRKFGTQGALDSYYTSKMLFNRLGLPEELEREMMIDSRMTLPPQLGTSIRDSGGLIGMYRRQIEDARIPLNRQALRDYNRNLRAGIADDDYFITIRNINRDYINKDLTGVDFSGLRIPMMNFTNTNFTDADLSNTIHGSNFYRNCNFQRANLQGADLEWAGFPGCNFEGATYDGNTVLPRLGNFSPEDNGMIRVNNFGKKKKKKKKK